jgi:hypothetical protein
MMGAGWPVCELELDPALGSGNANLLVGLHMRGGTDMLGTVVADRVSGSV